MRLRIQIVVTTMMAVVCCSWAQLSHAGSINTKLKIGDVAPAWKSLPGTDDQSHSLADLKEKSVVVVCFTSNSCPYSVDYQDRMIALHKKYADQPQGVSLVAINANKKPSEQLEKMKERANEKGFPFAYLADDTQEVADAWGASFTPEFFVLNKERQVVFMGAMDDKTDEAQVTVHYVEMAIEAALKGEFPEIKEVPARGCAIPFKKSRK
jgi:peroxiredoxin